MPASLPFQDTKTDGQGNAVAVEASQPTETSDNIKRRGRRKKVVGKRLFAIHSAEGCFICPEEELVATLQGKSETDVYVLEKKVKSITVVPGKRNLLSGESEKDAIEITLE